MKIGISTILAAIGLALVSFGFYNQPGIAPLAIGLILLIGVLDILGILHIGKLESKGTRVFNALLTFVTIILILNSAGYTAPTNPLSVPLSEDTTQAQGATGAAILRLNMKDMIGGVYAGSGTVYAPPAGTVTNRNDLMKLIQDGKTAQLTPYTMTLASGVFSFNGYPAKIGDTITFAGYQDATPGAAENVSFVMTVSITGMTAGSTPEWMISTPQYVWYNYPTLLYYNYADTAVTVYTEDEDAAIEKTLTFSMFPSVNGERWTDGYLWVEAPSANIGAIKNIKITASDGQTAEYAGIPAEVTSSENLFRAVPALTTSTDTMYLVGKFPSDGLARTSTSQKAKQTVEVTYDHPASGNVSFYFKTTQNTNALTSTGGHYDSPSTNLQLNMTTVGTDAWT
jgi:hypothetical protein